MDIINALFPATFTSPCLVAVDHRHREFLRLTIGNIDRPATSYVSQVTDRFPTFPGPLTGQILPLLTTIVHAITKKMPKETVNVIS